MVRYDLSETEWRLIQPLLPNKPRGIARVDHRLVLSGIVFVISNGLRWREEPTAYAPTPSWPPITIPTTMNHWTNDPEPRPKAYQNGRPLHVGKIVESRIRAQM